jgi:hypothetical protein
MAAGRPDGVTNRTLSAIAVAACLGVVHTIGLSPHFA